jgi:hypothetical protein
MPRKDPEAKKAYDKEYYIKNKATCRQNMKAYYAEHREEILECQRKWAANHPEEIKKRNRRWREADIGNQKRNAYERQRNFERRREDPVWAEHRRELGRIYRERKRQGPVDNNAGGSPIAHTAHARVHYYVGTGTIVKPPRCSKCGADTPLKAHHNDYSKPLDIVWLCSFCHGETHLK